MQITLPASNNVTNPTIDTATNRFSSGQNYSYDKDGNLTNDASGNQFLYDAENHQKEVKNSSNQIVGLYVYDGEGRRVKKISSTETTIFVYDGGGQLVAEYSTALATTPQVSYLTADHLGSPRVITNQLGAVTTRKDYMAFGEETYTTQRTSAINYDNQSETRKGYTGYEKDDESGLDFAQARYYNSKHGRFTSVDPLTASANVKNPQTFNRYSYVLNSPYKFTDPLGLLSSSTGACGQWCRNSDSGSGGGGFNAASSLWTDLATVTIDLNIVYDENQYTLEQAQAAVKDTVKDLQDTYSAISVEFNVTYTAGQADYSKANNNGSPGTITKGAVQGSINVFLFANNKFNGRSSSLYNPKTVQIFMWEGTFSDTPSASNVTDKLSSSALAHEVGHLFFHFAGMPMTESVSNNVSQDAGIGYATNQMRYNPLFIADSELPDDFDYNKISKGGLYTPPKGTKHNPTYEQLLRFGAKRVAAIATQWKK